MRKFIIVNLIALIMFISSLLVYTLFLRKPSTTEYTIDKDKNFSTSSYLEESNGVFSGSKGDYVTTAFETNEIVRLHVLVNGKELATSDWHEETEPPGIIIRLLNEDGSFIQNITNLAIETPGTYRLSISSSAKFEIQIQKGE